MDSVHYGRRYKGQKFLASRQAGSRDKAAPRERAASLSGSTVPWTMLGVGWREAGSFLT